MKTLNITNKINKVELLIKNIKVYILTSKQFLSQDKILEPHL